MPTMTTTTSAAAAAYAFPSDWKSSLSHWWSTPKNASQVAEEGASRLQPTRGPAPQCARLIDAIGTVQDSYGEDLGGSSS